jgi:hypothetical protein
MDPARWIAIILAVDSVIAIIIMAFWIGRLVGRSEAHVGSTRARLDRVEDRIDRGPSAR